MRPRAFRPACRTKFEAPADEKERLDLVSDRLSARKAGLPSVGTEPSPGNRTLEVIDHPPLPRGDPGRPAAPRRCGYDASTS